MAVAKPTPASSRAKEPVAAYAEALLGRKPEIHTFGVLIRNYRSSLRPHLKWSDSKDKWLNYLEADFGEWALDDFSTDALVSWAIESERSKLVCRFMLCTLGAVLSTGQMLWDTAAEPEASRIALKRLTVTGLLPVGESRVVRISDKQLTKISYHWKGRISAEILFALVDLPIRSGELCRLKWRDLDKDGRTILIRDRKHPTMKHGNHQRVPLLGRFYDLIMEQPRREERIFPIVQASLSQGFRSAAASARIHDLHLHDLRHEGISRLFDRGWTIPQVAAVSGHRTWETLKRYTHVSPSELLELAGTSAR